MATPSCVAAAAATTCGAPSGVAGPALEYLQQQWNITFTADALNTLPDLVEAAAAAALEHAQTAPDGSSGVSSSSGSRYDGESSRHRPAAPLPAVSASGRKCLSLQQLQQCVLSSDLRALPLQPPLPEGRLQVLSNAGSKKCGEPLGVPLLLMLLSSRDITQPLKEGAEDFSADGHSHHSRRRLLLLKLTDGRCTYTAIERSHCAQLNKQVLVPGVKLLLLPSTLVLSNMLLLTPESVQVAGGGAAALASAYRLRVYIQQMRSCSSGGDIEPRQADDNDNEEEEEEEDTDTVKKEDGNDVTGQTKMKKATVKQQRHKLQRQQQKRSVEGPPPFQPFSFAGARKAKQEGIHVVKAALQHQQQRGMDRAGNEEREGGKVKLEQLRGEAAAAAATGNMAAGGGGGRDVSAAGAGAAAAKGRGEGAEGGNVGVPATVAAGVGEGGEGLKGMMSSDSSSNISGHGSVMMRAAESVGGISKTSEAQLKGDERSSLDLPTAGNGERDISSATLPNGGNVVSSKVEKLQQLQQQKKVAAQQGLCVDSAGGGLGGGERGRRGGGGRGGRGGRGGGRWEGGIDRGRGASSASFGGRGSGYGGRQSRRPDREFAEEEYEYMKSSKAPVSYNLLDLLCANKESAKQKQSGGPSKTSAVTSSSGDRASSAAGHTVGNISGLLGEGGRIDTPPPPQQQQHSKEGYSSSNAAASYYASQAAGPPLHWDSGGGNSNTRQQHLLRLQQQQQVSAEEEMLLLQQQALDYYAAQHQKQQRGNREGSYFVADNNGHASGAGAAADFYYTSTNIQQSVSLQQGRVPTMSHETQQYSSYTTTQTYGAPCGQTQQYSSYGAQTLETPSSSSLHAYYVQPTSSSQPSYNVQQQSSATNAAAPPATAVPGMMYSQGYSRGFRGSSSRGRGGGSRGGGRSGGRPPRGSSRGKREY